MIDSKAELDEVVREASKINLTLSPKYLEALGKAMGKDLSKPPVTEEVRRAKEWLNSPEKRRREQLLARILVYPLGLALSKWLKTLVQSYDGTDGLFAFPVFFMGTEQLYQHFEVKIRTMKPGAHKPPESLFDVTVFKGGLETERDERILPVWWAQKLRRLGLDELPQLIQIAQGSMALTGLRPYTKFEAWGLRTLHKYRNVSQLNLEPEVIELLDTYPALIDEYQPDPALMGPLSATFAKDTPAMERLRFDREYLLRTDPKIDILLFKATIERRLQGVGAR